MKRTLDPEITKSKKPKADRAKWDFPQLCRLYEIVKQEQSPVAPLDWHKVKRLLQSPYSNHQLRSKWNKIAKFDFAAIVREQQAELEEEKQCKLCQSSRSIDTCEWCRIKHLRCAPDCVGRCHFPHSADTHVTKELRQVQSLQLVVRLIHMGRTTIDSDTIKELNRFQGMCITVLCFC